MPKLQYKNYLLILLTLIATFNYLDRFVLALVLEPIKQEFQLSDSQLGLLSGFAFALFYATAGIPIARWADRGNRNTIVTLTTGLWSAMVALSGLVGNFTQLLLVRVGVAVGEAGCLPTGQSLISDYFDRADRLRAMAIYWLCAPIAMIVGYFGGGWLAEAVGWRTTFILMGLPGVLLALIARLTLREPRLKKNVTIGAECLSTSTEHYSFKEVLTTLWQVISFRHLVVAFCIAYFFGMGIGQWLPTFFIRSHGMSAGELGTWLALTWGVCGVPGTYLGGILASRYASKKEALQMRAIAVLFTLTTFLYALICLSPSQAISITLLGVNGFTFGLTNGVVFAAILSLVDERMRSTAMALIFLLANLVGLGLGPIAVGMLSDGLMPMYGNESLRFALVCFSPGYLWVAFHYWKASSTIEADISCVTSSQVHTDSSSKAQTAPQKVTSTGRAI